MSEPKPCPFCGGTNLKSGGDDKFVGFWCLDCGCVGPNHYDSARDWNVRANRIEELESKSDGQIQIFGLEGSYDLIEVKPEVVVWVVINKDGLADFSTETAAIKYQSKWGGAIHRFTLNEENRVDVEDTK